MQLELWRLIKGVDKQIKRRLDDAFVPSGLTGTQAPVLHFIWVAGRQRDVFQRDIEAEFDIRRSSVSSVLDGLERGGYIRRESVRQDARLKKLVPTGKGADIFQQVDANIASLEAQMTHSLTPQETSTLAALLGRVSANLSAAGPPPGCG